MGPEQHGADAYRGAGGGWLRGAGACGDPVRSVGLEEPVGGVVVLLGRVEDSDALHAEPVLHEQAFPHLGCEHPHVHGEVAAAGQVQDFRAWGDGGGGAVAGGVGVQHGEVQPAPGLEGGGQGGQEPVGVEEVEGAEGVDHVVGSCRVQVFDGVGVDQAQSWQVGVAGAGPFDLAGGGVDGVHVCAVGAG